MDNKNEIRTRLRFWRNVDEFGGPGRKKADLIGEGGGLGGGVALYPKIFNIFFMTLAY